MTDKEIIKAMEVCYADGIQSVTRCENCPIQDDCHNYDFFYLEKQALDLIKRQQSEIKELRWFIKTDNKVVKPFTNFQHLKMLNVDEMAEFLDGLTKECGSRECGNCPLNIDDEECSKKTIKKWLESEFEQ